MAILFLATSTGLSQEGPRVSYYKNGGIHLYAARYAGDEIDHQRTLGLQAVVVEVGGHAGVLPAAEE